MRSVIGPVSLHLGLCLLIFGNQNFYAQIKAPEHNSQPTQDRASTAYQKWLDEDVTYIITDKEKADFATLTSDQQRDQFIAEFWQSRNPTANSQQNPFKTEHYRRLAYSNQHFAFPGIPGWKSDRGRIYITYGAPDEREQHPGQTSIALPENGIDTLRSPSDAWRYGRIDGIGRDVTFTFVDHCRCGEFRLENDPTVKPKRGSRSHSRA